MAMTQAQIEAEIRRKANEGIALDKPTAEKQALYDTTRNNITNEINRKADSGIALSGNSTGNISAYNQALYDERLKNNKGSEGENGGGSTITAQSTTSNSLIDSIYNNNLNSQIQALNKARDTALQGLNGLETQAKQGAYDNRNSADAANMQNVQRLREIMASNGLTASGDNITANASLAASRQGELGQINRQEQNALQDIGERRTVINNNAAGDELSIMQQLQAAKDNMLLQDIYRQQDNSFRDKQFDRGIYESDRGFNRGVLESDRNYNYQKATTEWNQNFQQGQFDWQKAQQAWENAFQDKSFEQSIKQYASQMGYNWASLSQRQQESIADQAFRERQFTYEKERDALARQDSLTGKPRTADTYYDSIDKSSFLSPETTMDLRGQPVKTGKTIVSNPEGLEKYILSLGLSDTEAQKLYYRYGLNWGG